MLLLVWSLALVSPLFARTSDAALPACCRRDGKHHCAMAGMQDPDAQPSFSAVQAKCPMFPASTVSWDHGPQFLPNISQAFYAGVVSHPVVHAQVESLCRIAWERSRQKRGPPIVLA
ncbi:MAG: hypothetical protein JST79_15095 [Acidobacteria bacterium]|nr:hypothetical protein [Acidobacteriota bacterium]